MHYLHLLCESERWCIISFWNQEKKSACISEIRNKAINDIITISLCPNAVVRKLCPVPRAWRFECENNAPEQEARVRRERLRRAVRGSSTPWEALLRRERLRRAVEAQVRREMLGCAVRGSFASWEAKACSGEARVSRGRTRYWKDF